MCGGVARFKLLKLFAERLPGVQLGCMLACKAEPPFHLKTMTRRSEHLLPVCRYGYGIDPPGRANLTLCSKQVRSGAGALVPFLFTLFSLSFPGAHCLSGLLRQLGQRLLATSV